MRIKRLVGCAALLLPLLMCRAQGTGETVIGSCERAITAVQSSTGYDSTVAETELGNLLADGVRAESGAQAAVVCGGHIAHSITYGEITEADVTDAVDADAAAVLVEMTPQELWELLETALSGLVLDEQEALDTEASSSPYYPQVSGLSMRYDISQPPGEKLVSVSVNGEELNRYDGARTLSVAVSADYLSVTDLMGAVLPRTEAECLISYVASMGEVDIPITERTTAIGSYPQLFTDYRLIRLLPLLVLLILVLILPRQRHRLRNMDGSLSKRYRDYHVP